MDAMDGCDLVRVDLVIAVMAIQCGLVAGALGILMLIIIARSRLFTLVSHSWCQFTDGGQHIMSMIDPKMLISYDRWQLLMH